MAIARADVEFFRIHYGFGTKAFYRITARDAATVHDANREDLRHTTAPTKGQARKRAILMAEEVVRDGAARTATAYEWTTGRAKIT